MSRGAPSSPLFPYTTLFRSYWALPAMGDAVGWTYRKDWFAKPELQKEFKAQHGHDLAPPKTWDEFLQVAKFFQGRQIDGKRSEEHTSELQSHVNLVCRLLLE